MAMASAFKKVKKKFTGKGKGKRQGDDTREGKESQSLPDVVMEAHNQNAPISQPSTSSQKSSVGSEKSDLKSVGGSLDSKLSELNLQDVFDKKFPKASQGGVAAATATATAQACGNNDQGASGVSNKPPDPNSGSSRASITHCEETHNQVPNIDGGVVTVPNSEASGDGLTHSEQTHTQVPNVPEPDNTDGGVSTDLNSEASRGGITHCQQTHSQVPNMPEPDNTDGGVSTDLNSEASRGGITHSQQTHSQVPDVPEPANTDGGIPMDLNSEASRVGIIHSQQTHSQVLNVPDPVNADELVNPDSNNEASRDDHNQERNAATTRGNEVSNLNQEATVPVAAVAAVAATAAPPHLDGTNLQSLTSTPIQEEAEHRVDNGRSTNSEIAPSEEAANNYDYLYVSDVITNSKFLEDKLARELDHTSHRVIKTWEHLACTKEVNAPLEMRLQCKLNSESYSCTQMLIDILTVEMEDKTVYDLIEALRAINRRDVVRIITESYSDAENSTEKISDFASSHANSKVIKEMATKLDQKSRVLGNWLDLGRQFKISGDKLKEIEYGQFNPTLVLMEYLYSKQEHLTVGKFYEEVKKLKRRDVLKKLDPFLSEHREEHMKEVIKPDDDVMTSICLCLNNPNRVLKNWRHLASAFNVPREMYKDFNPEKPMSPTSVLFKWISANRTDLTVGQLCTALKSIERNDVVRDLRNYVQEQQSTGRE